SSDLEQAIAKFRSMHITQQKQQGVKALKEDLDEETLERIVVKNGTQIKLIPVQQIIYLEAYDDYVKIHTKEGMFLKNKTMSSFEKQLDTRSEEHTSELQ